MPTLTLHRRMSSVWKPMLDRDCTNSAVLVALQRNAERSKLEMPKDLAPNSTCVDAEEDGWKKRLGANALSRRALNPRAQVISSFRFPPLQGPKALDIFLPETCVKILSESASTTSDTTLFDEPVVYPGLFKDADMLQAYTALDNTVRRRSTSADGQQSRLHSTNSLSAHHRHVSSDSALDAIGAPPLPLRSRAKANDGLLSFKANPSRDSNRKGHHRRVSLKLPVKPQSSGLGTLHWINQPDVGNRNMSSHQLHTAVDRDILTSEEQDLEYKHRHMFIGTGSLDDFLDLLEISSARVATQSATARAFVQLASAEQLYARQCSSRPEGWELVSRTTLDVMDVTSVDYVVQLQVKLGSITLRQFLDMIPFDENNEVAATQVIKAFSAASYIDAKANMGMENKARAFRSWIVSQEEEPGLQVNLSCVKACT
ncbi:hypothetical protein DDE82_001983 [Stemphylium lycopersici]|uniref:Uncharacterized protein n=1 Tax=Stemphylium lycopersici TaxID=183478 RepID=A0A364N4H1_STELY|nr:hypothetical protein DDE82_001983 [Stemphylium lycopersici]RAR11388.1 hypothetical protein DDE83_004644 [Stemphylium lycopersici]